MPSVEQSREPVAFITGGASPVGMGACTGRRLARAGWRVWLSDVDSRVAATAGQMAAELGLSTEMVVGTLLDVTGEAQVERVIGDVTARWGRLDLAVANAGISLPGADVADQTTETFDQLVAINLRGVFFTCRAAARFMRQAKSGSIVTVSSIFGQEANARGGAYSATKAGVIALTQALAREMAPYGVRVNAIAPGYIRTEMLDEVQAGRAKHAGLTFEEEVERVNRLIPLGRHGTGDDIAAAIAFLASADASYITGHTLGVTGGVVMR